MTATDLPRFAITLASPDTQRLARTPRWVRRGAVLLVLFVLVLVPILLYAPWVQTAHGFGRAVAFNPTQRPQPLNSPIAGRVYRWYVVEGKRVRAGELVAELKDNDPLALERLEHQKELAAERLTFAAGAVADQAARLTFVENEQPIQLGEADARIQAAEAQVVQANANRARAKADVVREELALKRAEELNKSKIGPLASGDAVEEAVRKRDGAREQAAFADAGLAVAERSLAAVRKFREGLEQRTGGLIQAEKLALASREGEKRAAEAAVLAATTAVERQKNQYIYAPADGTVAQILVNADGQFVSAGQPLATLVPDVKPSGSLPDPRVAAVGAAGGGLAGLGLPGLTPEAYPGIVVELSIDGNDLPLVARGDRVLLQFEGWPAVQVAGVPGAAQGTFEGRVYLVDPTADRAGKFRVLVEPLNPGVAPVEMEVAGRQAMVRPWPDPELLRQGVRAQGWVLVRQVSVGYELWRLLNGFPAARELKPKDAGSVLGPVKGK